MSQESPFWIFFGKVSAVITTFAALVAIWVVGTQISEDLELYVDSRSYSVRPDLKDKISKHFSTYSHDNLSKLIKNSSLPKELIENEFILVNFIRKLQDDSWGMESVLHSYDLPRYRGYNHLVLSNNGDKVATEIAIDFPEKGIALIIDQDNSKKLISFNQVIKLNDLRANNEITLVIWSENKLSRYEYKEINITHHNGVGEVIWPIEAKGLSLYIQIHPYLTILFFYLIFMFAMFLGSVTGSSKKEEGKKDAGKSKTDIVEST